MKKTYLLAAAVLVAGCASPAVSSAPQNSSAGSEAEPVVETFSAEYEMVGTTSAGLPKNDTFIFEGETTDGIITSLNFDIIRNKGLEGEYSKKGIMGYMMNVSDGSVEKTDTGYNVSICMNGYNDDFGQYMITGTLENATGESVFSDLTIANYDGTVLTDDQKLEVYQHLADEADITLTLDTPVTDLLAIHGLAKDGEYTEGKNRVSFAGYHGGRSYGEQIDAIVEHILTHNMTLEDVYEMFKTVNQQSTPINERDVVTGATIAFVGDFQRMTYIAMTGELFEGVVSASTADGVTTIEVATQGFGGEIETHFTVDADKKITAVKVRDAQESEDYGAKLTAEGSEFLQTIIDQQNDLSSIDTATGATTTAKSLVKAAEFAEEYIKNNLK